MTTGLAELPTKSETSPSPSEDLQNALQILFDAHKEKDLLMIQTGMHMVDFWEYLDRLDRAAGRGFGSKGAR